MAGNVPSLARIGKLSRAKAIEYSLVDSYKYAYRNREDITKMPPSVLIVGSQNVLHNVSDRIQMRQGYSLDGAVSSVAAPVLASFDFQTRDNNNVHLRVGGLTSAGNDGKLQYRYVDGSGNVTWRDLTTGLTTVNYNFCTFFDSTENLRVALFVNGTSNIFEWNGATAIIASTTANTITKTGTESWLDTGFYSTANKSIVINGNTYPYSGGENTTTLTGVLGDPTGEANGSIVHQSVVTTANSSMTGISSTFPNGLMANLNNQIYVGALTSPALFISKISNYKDYTFSTPRQTGEGWNLILDENLIALEPQESTMYVSAGDDLWYSITFELQTSTVGVTYQQVNSLLLKSTAGQGAQSQAFVSQMKNNIIVLTNEPTMDIFGTAENYFNNPQTQNISDPIKLDFDQYDFTDGSIFYFQYFIYIAIPKEGLVRIYNIVTKSWEAPQTLPISRFYIVDGELYGHSYNTFESYKLFTGYADRVSANFNGYPINAKAVFSYQNYGSRSVLKKANGLYIEGYITSNTILNAMITYELDGCSSTRNFTINGSDTQIVCIPSAQGALGKQALGKIKLGGTTASSLTGLPPKFRVEKKFTNRNFFESSISFEVIGINQRFEILAFGLNASYASEEPVKIRQ